MDGHSQGAFLDGIWETRGPGERSGHSLGRAGGRTLLLKLSSTFPARCPAVYELHMRSCATTAQTTFSRSYPEMVRQALH